MLNAHIGAIYLQKYKKNQKKRFYGWILFAGLTWFNFICKQGDNEDVFSVILGSKYIVSLHLILNLNFNLTFCNLLFFLIISNAIISFLCTAFLGIYLSACFGNIVDFQNIFSVFFEIDWEHNKTLDAEASRVGLSVTSSLIEETKTNLIAHNNDRLPLRTSSLSEETNTNLIAHNNSGYSLRSFQRETYFAKGPFPPCSLRYFRERSIILSISSNEKSNFFLRGFLSFSSASRIKRSASSPVNTGVLLISNAIILRKNSSDSSYYFYCTDDSNYTC